MSLKENPYGFTQQLGGVSTSGVLPSLGIVEKNMETTIQGLYRDYIGVMLGRRKKNMETTIQGLYRGYLGMMAKKMASTVGFRV